MRKIPGIVVTVLALGLSACSHATDGTATPTPGSSTAPIAPSPAQAAPVTAQPDCAAGYLAQFNERQKLAQLLTVGVTGTADAQAVVRNEQVGGIFIGGWTDQAMVANKQLDQVTSLARVPLMVTIDEEGGRVSRVGNLIGEAPSARAAAASMSADDYYQQTLTRAKALKDLGITVDFAPDVDVSDQPDDSVIGDRSYSNDPDTVTGYADAMIRALHDAGLGAVMKHFPGHGHGSGDSHKGAVQTPPLDQLKQVDLVPFRNLITSGAGVMVGHLDVPGLTESGVPASISPEAMTLLRQGAGYGAAPFDGPIFTDDLSGMKAITARMDIEEAVAAALEAGADSALWITTTDVSKVLDHLEQEVRSGKLPADRVDASVLRLARFKGVPLHC
ncbi:glycoside hydrolase family 3 N-terminal domain-containing protein [Nocardia sp. alder85J]|uniref:glycoside hydrolase family 3 N-terminal domain-containing protein n=1 Tax=Nocardia sp. alder85J TaxID=2862949 RepID=UPI001CD4E816|nr:glycoside hydrolase family 3 N-terminal domain-containing protein [Nocardia sp. alder85J]MCX4096296.1 glycoside hydrolase family 3 protein [Nocardia sp. alder85J]